MEKRQKNLISVFLLVVGVIFILVAGGIFVTTAWKYLPMAVKQLALLVVAGGMFGGSHCLSKNEKLGWISETLFHLGNAFVGFFTIAVMGGVVENSLVGNAFKVMVASGAMAMLLGMKLIYKKSPFDFAVLSLLVDGVLISGCIAFDTTFNAYMYWLAGFTVLLAMLDAHQYKQETHDGFALCVGVTYLVHACIYGMLAGIGSLATLTTEYVCDGILWFGMVVAMATLSWMVRTNVILRVLQSFSIIWFVFIVVNGIFYVTDAGEFGGAMLLTTLIVSVLTVWLGRKEMVGILVAASVVIPFGQLFGYWLDTLVGLFNGIDKDWSTTYNPYSFIIGVALFALYIVKYGSADIFTKWRDSRLLKLAGVQIVTGCFVWIASKMSNVWVMVFFLLIALDMSYVASLFQNKTAKRVFETVAMINMIIAIACQPFVMLPKEYMVEWDSLLVGIGIVLFRHIWYDYRKQLSVFYFVATCVILSVMLLSDVSYGGIGNVLILGITGMIMLIVAAMGNHKKYVIAASATLIILVLYLTRDVWLSIAWWVYLFAAGVVLVLLAVKKAKEA